MSTAKKPRELIEQLKGLPIEQSQLEDILASVEALKEKAYTNPVSGYHNLLQLEEDLPQIIEIYEEQRQQGEARKTYVAMLDIDNFGRFNKEYGETIGNEVLRFTAQVLEDSLRSEDIFVTAKEIMAKGYHLHGEEKMIIYMCNSDEEAVQVAERVRQAIADRSQSETGYQITETIGITAWDPLTEEFKDAQHRADLNMQKAKKLGKNQVLYE